MDDVFLLLLLLWAAPRVAVAQKHILFILADDLGYNDVSWHNPDVITPNLDALARTGTIFENHYVQPLCTPTRAALMTGYYPVHTGRQMGVLGKQEPKGLFTNFTLLPERLNELGYRSHIVGKWHLGYCSEDYLPTNRGFLSFHGLFHAAGDHFEHTAAASAGGGPAGYDFHANEDVDYSAEGFYSSHVIADHASHVINRHATNHPDEPLFLYLPFQAAHTPLQVPKQYTDLYPDIQNSTRKNYLGMVTALDEAVGNVTRTLKSAGLYEDTIIVFSADNGGPTDHGANNYPLRGSKNTLWEGGTRSSSFIHAPFLGNGGTVYNGLLHVTDWLPTLYSAAGGPVAQLGDIDGVDQWEALTNLGPSNRNELLYNILPSETPGAALRVGDLKLICGKSGSNNGWPLPPDVTSLGENENDSAAAAINYPRFTANCREGGSLQVRLFNLTSDPNEHTDISLEFPEYVETLLDRLEELEASAIPPHNSAEVEEGNPNNFGGVYTPGWCLSEPQQKL